MIDVLKVKEQLALEIGTAYNGVLDTRSLFAVVCAESAVHWLDINNDEVSAITSSTRKDVRKKRKAMKASVKSFISNSVKDYEPVGFINTTFWAIIGPYIINWVANLLLSLLFNDDEES